MEAANTASRLCVSEGQTELFVVKLFCKTSHTMNSSHHILNISDLLEALILRNKLNSKELLKLRGALERQVIQLQVLRYEI